MNFNLTNTEWTKITGLIEGKTYILQAKRGKNEAITYNKTNILLTVQDDIPENLREGLLDSEFKFVAENNVYIRAISLPVNINVYEVD